MKTELILHPDTSITVTGDEESAVRLRGEFSRGTGFGLAALLRDDLIADGGPCLLFLRQAARQMALYLVRNGDTAPESLPDASVSTLLASLPPELPCAGIVTANFLQTVFRFFLAALKSLSGKESPADAVRALRTNWKDLGKVMFHLAANKKDADGTKPFAFLATYQNKLSETGQVKHLPLGSAVTAYAEDKKTLLSFLLPLKNAAQNSPLLQKMLDDNRIFKPVFFTADEAWEFLRSAGTYQEEGIPVRFAGLWSDRPKRLKMDVALDVRRKRGLLAADSLVRFSVGASIGGLKLTEEELNDILNSKGGLIRIKGEWVEAETARIRELLEKWHAASRFAGNAELSFCEALRLLSGVRGLDGDKVPVLEDDICEVNASPELRDAIAELTDPEKMSLPPLPERLDRMLRPYQRTGVKFLWNMLRAGFGVCLADDMGLGKTLQMITCMELLRAEGAFSELPALIVVPASLLNNWLEEFRKFAPELRVGSLHPSALDEADRMKLNDDPLSVLKQYDAVLVTYSMVPRRDFLRQYAFPLIVLDEAQQIKNPSSGVSRAVRSLRGVRRVAMTGTPVENSLSDLWSIFDFICPGLLGKPDAFRAFVRRMEETKPLPDYSPLRKLVRPYILHRLKTDKNIIADLPDKIERCERTPLTALQAKIYRRAADAMKKELALADDQQRNGVILSYLLQFKQICNHPSQFSGNTDFAPERSGKLMRLGRLADFAARRGEKMLVFTQFKEMTEVLHEFLTAHFHRPGLILHGGTPIEKRAEEVRAFQREDGPPFFVISLKAGGTGLNLTAAVHVVHFDRWWNPAVENQATDRAYRIGQKRTVFVHKFVSPGTVEEKIDRLISGKKFLATSLLEKGTAQLLTEMTNEQLLDFVKLDMDAVMDDEPENEEQKDVS